MKENIKNIELELERLQDELLAIEDVKSVEYRKLAKHIKALESELEKAKALNEANTHRSPLFESKLAEYNVVAIINKYFLEELGINVSIINEGDNAFKVILPTAVNTPPVNKGLDRIAKDLKHLIKDECIDEVWVNLCEDGNYTIYLFQYDTQGVEPVEPQLPLQDLLTEAINKQDAAKHISDANQILDDKFIWVFTVLDGQGDILKEDIYEVDEAIALAAEHDKAEMIVAYPYVDPDPENPAVDLVFADNPGPTILYDSRQATRPKDKTEKELAEEELRAIERGEEDLSKKQLESKTIKENTIEGNKTVVFSIDLEDILSMPHDSRYDSLLDMGDLVDKIYDMWEKRLNKLNTEHELVIIEQGWEEGPAVSIITLDKLIALTGMNESTAKLFLEMLDDKLDRINNEIHKRTGVKLHRVSKAV